ncbi:MAG TPA: DUF3142 domain-containing protein [Candidatus Binatia bacterium]|nr:DUF3142 domain-containing protein [Candidatus Binatia bacterium]
MARTASAVGLIALLLPAGQLAAAPRLGQWIWCAADRRHFEEAVARHPAIVPGVLVGTITVRDGQARLHRGLSPDSVASPSGVVPVIRFEDGFHGVWTAPDAPAQRERVAATIEAVVTAAERTGVEVTEVQLDYDCPTSRLRDWAGFLRALRGGALADRQVWITSIPAHLDEPRYGDWFRPVVAGHVLQVFDTGVPPSRRNVARLVALARRHDLPFRIGLGAFERLASDHAGWHAGWFDRVDRFARDPRFAGVWVFPAGRSWEAAIPPTLRALEGRR